MWGDTDTDTDTETDTETKNASGTSIAAPHVAGTIALILADNPDATPEQVATTLDENATDGAVKFPPADTTSKLLRVVE